MSRFSNLIKCSTKSQKIDLYTVAVLRNCTSILKCLQKFEIPAKDFGPLNALDFAICLNRRECIDILSCTFQRKLTDLADASPSLEIQRFGDEESVVMGRVFGCMGMINTVKYKRNPVMSQYLEEIIRTGHNVNFEDPNGMTALQLAIYRSDYSSVRTLLQNGANPFIGQSFLKTNGTLRFLIEMFHCNLNVHGKVQKVYEIAAAISHRTISGYYREGSLKGLADDFILQCVHSLSKADRAYLDMVDANMCRVQPLTTISRNSLRRHFGLNIHKFVHSEVMPRSLRRYILLEDVIDRFCAKLKWNIVKNSYRILH